MFLMAIEVHHQYVLNFTKGTSAEYEYVQISGNEMRKALRPDRRDYLSGEETDLFLNYLDMYFGLRMAKTDYPPTLSNYFFVIKK
jgi:hypothetical protein